VYQVQEKADALIKSCTEETERERKECLDDKGGCLFNPCPDK
jgi:hypothetical protein